MNLSGDMNGDKSGGPHGLVTIDCDYVFPGFAAAYLRTEGDEAAFIETNTAHAVPKMLRALAAKGLEPAAVRWIVVTHVHLDHAGGAGALVRACPNATVLAHPRAARHLVDPSKLVASATKVYGEERFRDLYGEIAPIPESRVRALDDGAEVPFGDTKLRVLYTRGHANHHFVVHDPALDPVFTGDAFGLAYPALQRRGPFVFPSTSPTDYDGPEARAAIAKIEALGARRAMLTHFGEVTAIGEAATQLRSWLDTSDELLDDAASSDRTGPALESMIERGLRDAFERRARERGLSLTADDWSLVRLDLELNAQGLAWVASKRRAS